MALMKLLARSWFAAILCLLSCAVPAQGLEIIDLRYRTAPEIIPVLQPLVEPGGAISGSDYKLFVRASAANVAQIKRALEQIDRQPRSLMVSVRRASRQRSRRPPRLARSLEPQTTGKLSPVQVRNEQRGKVSSHR